MLLSCLPWESPVVGWTIMTEEAFSHLDRCFLTLKKTKSQLFKQTFETRTVYLQDKVDMRCLKILNFQLISSKQLMA